MASLSVFLECINPATRRVEEQIHIATQTCHGSGSHINQGASTEKTTVFLEQDVSDGIK